MDTFSFVFSLYSIILGLALTEVLGGAARAVKGSSAIRVGWLTGLLAATLAADITLFWRIIWKTRTVMPDTSPALFAGVVICGLYYFAAALLFPDTSEATDDLDGYFLAEKGKVLACIWIANFLAYGGRVVLLGWSGSFGNWNWTDWAEVATFMTCCAVAIFVTRRRILVILLGAMLAADLIDPVFSAIGNAAS